MYNTDEVQIIFSTKHLPFEYKWLEYRLMINKELYDEKAIDFKTFSVMEQSIMSRLSKINNNSVDLPNKECLDF